MKLLLLLGVVLGARAGNLVEELTRLNASTLVQLATTAGLADTLTTGGPFTLIAPTDAAFAKLPSATLAKLQADKAALADLLKYHLIQGDIFSWDLTSGTRYKTLNDRSVQVTTSTKGTTFNGATVVQHDNVASNGVIYLVDTVLTVPEKSMLSAIKARPELSTMVTAVIAAQMERTFNSSYYRYPITLFAPTNAAFARLDKEKLSDILENRRLLLELLDYHIHLGALHRADITPNRIITTRFSGHYISVASKDGGLVLNHVASLTEPDIEAENGIVHVIDHLLLPSSLAGIVG